MLDLNEALDLQQREIEISTVRKVGSSNTGGKLYCGRYRSRNYFGFNPMDLGLGNPSSHKNIPNIVKI